MAVKNPKTIKKGTKKETNTLARGAINEICLK
jgi:hypothetical protein